MTLAARRPDIIEPGPRPGINSRATLTLPLRGGPEFRLSVRTVPGAKRYARTSTRNPTSRRDDSTVDRDFSPWLVPGSSLARLRPTQHRQQMRTQARNLTQ